MTETHSLYNRHIFFASATFVEWTRISAAILFFRDLCFLYQCYGFFLWEHRVSFLWCSCFQQTHGKEANSMKRAPLLCPASRDWQPMIHMTKMVHCRSKPDKQNAILIRNTFGVHFSLFSLCLPSCTVQMSLFIQISINWKSWLPKWVVCLPCSLR